MLKVLFAAITILSPVVMIAAALRAYRLRYTARWLWVLLAFAGVATVEMDWASGVVTTQWATLNLIGFSISQTPPGSGPWVWAFTIPVGAVLVFLNRPRPTPRAAQPGTGAPPQ